MAGVICYLVKKLCGSNQNNIQHQTSLKDIPKPEYFKPIATYSNKYPILENKLIGRHYYSILGHPLKYEF